VQVCPTKQVLVPHEHNTVATAVDEHTGLVEHIFPLLVEHICPGLQVVIVPLVPHVHEFVAINVVEQFAKFIQPVEVQTLLFEHKSTDP